MNTRAEKSIYKAFLELYRKRNLTEISVKEICLKANVSRVTFYTYFEDISSLLNEIEEKTIADLNKIFKTWPYIDLTKLDTNKPISMLVDYYTYIHNNLDIFQAIFRSFSDPHFSDRFYGYARKSFADAVKLSKITSYPPEVLAVICNDGLDSLEKLWIFGKIKATPSEFALLIQKIIITVINSDD